MNFIPWNIVRKDFRLTRPYLLAWWGILAAGAVITIWNLDQIMADPKHFYSYDAARAFALYTGGFFQDNWTYFSNWVVLALDAVLLAVLVDQIIKSDSPIDEKAQWHTRPVSGLGVWRAKLMYVALFCFVIPGAIQTGERLGLGSDWADCLHGLARFAVLQALLVAIIACAAVLFQRTLSGVLIGCSIPLILLFAGATHYSESYIMDRLGYSVSSGAPNAWAAFTLLASTGLLVTAIVYGGNRRRRGWLAFSGGVLAAIVTFYVWPDDRLDEATTTGLLDNRAQVSFDSQPVSRMEQAWPATNLINISLSPKISFGKSPGPVLHVIELKSNLSWPGLKLPPAKSEWRNDLLFNFGGAVAAAGYGRLLMEPDTYLWDGEKEFSREQLAQAVSQPARWQGTIQGETGHLIADWNRPFADLGEFAHNETLFKVEKEQSYDTSHLSFELWETSPTHLPWMSEPTAGNHLPVLLLYNPFKHESILGGIGLLNGAPESLSVYFIAENRGSFDSADILGDRYPTSLNYETERKLYFNMHLPGQDPVAARHAFEAWARDRVAFLRVHKKEMDDWLAGARLVHLHFVPDQPVYNTVTVDLPELIIPAMATALKVPQP
jgi:hypothetical protein